jgi:hypothetical protein
MKMRQIIRSAMVALIAAATFAGTAQTANAVPPGTLTDDLAALWTTVLQTPSPDNPFGTGGENANACWDLGDHVVAPLSPAGVDSCTVRPGTRLFVAGNTVECSTPWEDAAREPGETLEQCARRLDVPTAPTVTVDGRPVSLTEVNTDVTPVTLPADNVFGSPDREGQFAAHGWVTLLKPLSVGTHTITINGTPTTIEVVPPGQQP